MDAAPSMELAGALPPARRRRVSLRSIGLLGVVALIALTTAMVACALLFGAAVQSHLQQLQETEARHDQLVQQRQQAQADAADPARIRELDLQVRVAGAERELHLATTRDYIDGSTVTLASLGWLGITSLGSLALLFFSRLASDIAGVRARALQILVGDRDSAAPLARTDELGDLSRAVENLADALGRRERELALERRHAMHQEKLATIGSMAAGVIREIGNPIAVIDGYARGLLDAQGGAPGDDSDALRAILRETARLIAISREISTLAAAPAPQWQLASLNEIVRQTLALLRYEPRLANVRITTALDPQLPAVMAFPDRLLQMLTGFAVNAADATAALPRKAAEIVIATRLAAGGVALTIDDNGSGRAMPAFEPVPGMGSSGRRVDQGAALCRSVVEAHGGRLGVAARPEGGTRVTVWLPLPGDGR